MRHSLDLIGAGWSFPLQRDTSGAIMLSRGQQDIDEAIRIILMTRVGERVMRPAFGCRLHELLFAPLNMTTCALARQYVLEALRYWEPRIDVNSVEVTPWTDERGRKSAGSSFGGGRSSQHAHTPTGTPKGLRPGDGCLKIVISYLIRATYDER